MKPHFLFRNTRTSTLFSDDQKLALVRAFNDLENSKLTGDISPMVEKLNASIGINNTNFLMKLSSGESIEVIEREMGWPSRSGKIIALSLSDILIIHYGAIPDFIG